MHLLRGLPARRRQSQRRLALRPGHAEELRDRLEDDLGRRPRCGSMARCSTRNGTTCSTASCRRAASGLTVIRNVGRRRDRRHRDGHRLGADRRPDAVGRLHAGSTPKLTEDYQSRIRTTRTTARPSRATAAGDAGVQGQRHGSLRVPARGLRGLYARGRRAHGRQLRRPDAGRSRYTGVQDAYTLVDLAFGMSEAGRCRPVPQQRVRRDGTQRARASAARTSSAAQPVLLPQPPAHDRPQVLAGVLSDRHARAGALDGAGQRWPALFSAGSAIEAVVVV